MSTNTPPAPPPPPQYLYQPALYPPLGQTTTIKASASSQQKTKIKFYAAMTVTLPPSPTETVITSIADSHRFQVLLWWSVNGRGIWKPARFTEVVEGSGQGGGGGGLRILDLHQTQSTTTNHNRRRDYFVLEFEYAGMEPLQFCLKYMFHDGPWLWEGSRIGKSDGRIVFQRSPPASSTTTDPLYHIRELLPDLPGKIWTPHQANTTNNNNVTIDYLTALLTSEQQSHLFSAPASLEKWVALVKIAAPWMGPAAGTRFFECAKDGIMLMWLRTDGRVVVLLPITGAPSLGGGTSYLVSDAEGRSEIVVRSVRDGRGDAGADEEQVHMAGVIVAVGESVERVVAAAVGFLKEFISDGKRDVLTGHQSADTKNPKSETESNNEAQPAQQNIPKEPNTKTTSPTTQQTLSSSRTAWETGLTYCTWNGLGWDLSEATLLSALTALEHTGFSVCNLLIDDNWQSLSSRNYGSSGTWSRFEANAQFPGGLKNTVANIRQKFPGIVHIGVWHALHGYWDGITPSSELAENYKTIQVPWNDNVNEIQKDLTFIHPEDIERFYDDFYKFLSDAGITCVKTDVQSRIDELARPSDKALLSVPYQSALMNAGNKYFEGRVIYSMAHIPQIYYHSLLPKTGVAKVMRTSDDFYPSVPASHAWHIHANTLNSLLFSHFHILPDWDMFQTHLPPPYNTLHAAARALSGGPIFITDTPGHSCTKTIASISAPSCELDGRTVTLNPSGIATPLNPFLQYGDEALCCVKNETQWGARFLGAFNVAKDVVTEILALEWVFGDARDEKMLIRSYRTGEIAFAEPRSHLVAELEPGEWDVFTAVPIRLSDIGRVASLGLLDKITGAAGVREWTVDGGTIEVEMRALGKLGVWIEGVVEKGLREVRVNRDVVDKVFWGVDEEKSVLEVDLVRVWEGMREEQKKGEEGVVECRVHVILA